MSVFRRAPPEDTAASTEDVTSETVTGERGTAAVSRPPSLQSRVSNLLAIGLIGAMALGLIGWYYAHSLSNRSAAREKAQSATKGQAQGEMVLPPLGRIDPPAPEGAVVADVLGPAPELPQDRSWPAGASTSSYTGASSNQAMPEDLALKRKLSAVVLVRAQSTSAVTPAAYRSEEDSSESAEMMVGGDSGAPRSTGGDLEALLRPSATPAVHAQVLPTQTLLLPKGAFIDCTLETAIDSTLPGMTTCVTATDTFGVDGTVVLLERGTKLVGETRGQVQRGSARLFVLWTEARTPTGVVVPLASPGTDALGRSGLVGKVNRHFFERFGAAILISLIDGAIQAKVQSESDGGTVIYSPSTSQEVMTEVLKSTVNVPPTVVKPQGDRIQVLVARDLDFRSVYELRRAASRE